MLVVIHGTDSYRIQEKTAATIRERRDHSSAPLEVIRIDCATPSASDDLQRNLKYSSFFAEPRLIVATNAAHEVMDDIIATYDLAVLTDIVFVAIQNTSEKGFEKSILAKLTKSSQASYHLEPLTGAAILEWMTVYCAQRAATLTPQIATLIAQRAGPDTRAIANELEKLIAFAQGGSLDNSMVEMLTPRRIERDEWELSNAVATYNKRSALTALWKKLQEGTPEQMLVGSLAASFRNLIMIQDLLNRQETPSAIAKTLGVHPFVVSKTLPGARAADTTRLTNAHRALARLDRQSKEGTADVVDSLFSILLAI